MSKIKRLIATVFIAFYFSISDIDNKIVYKSPAAIVFNIDSPPIYFPKIRIRRKLYYE